MAEALLTGLLLQALLLSLAVTLLWALRPLLKRLGASAVYAAWLLVPALLLTPALPRPQQEPLTLMLKATVATPLVALPALPTPPATQKPLWLLLWLGGSAVFIALQARRQWRLARLGKQLPAGSSPALVGLLRPQVALPVDFEQRFSPAEQQLILAHEQVHRERLDNLWNLLACALTALHWWNPLAWWALARLRVDQELSCDATVLRARPQARADYTQALLAAHGLKATAAPLASRWGSVHPLVERIAMLNHPHPPKRRHLLMLGIAMLATAGASYALQAAKAEPAVAEGFLQLRFDIRLSIDGKEIAHPRLHTFPAKSASILFNEPNAPRLWSLALNGRFTDSQHVMVETELGMNDDEPAILAWRWAKGQSTPPPVRQLAAPRLLIQDGSSGRVETTTPDGQHRLTMEIQVSSFRSATPDYSNPKF